MSETPNYLDMARAAIAASSSAPTDDVGAFYCAAARVALSRLKDEMKSTAAIIVAREEELVRRAAPKQQLAIDAGETKP